MTVAMQQHGDTWQGETNETNVKATTDEVHGNGITRTVRYKYEEDATETRSQSNNTLVSIVQTVHEIDKITVHATPFTDWSSENTQKH
jgi:hypothetical protein